MWLSVDNSHQHPKQSVVLKFLRDDQLHGILRYTKQKKSVKFKTHGVKTNKTYIYIYVQMY